MKAEKLADSESGADSLGIFMEGVYGPEWRATGNGLIPTHYIPMFTARAGRLQQAACGEYAGSSEHSTEPTCPTCRAYLEADAAMGDDPVGTPITTELPRTHEPDPVAEYDRRYAQLASRRHRGTF
jgi:hypothetical protein